MADIDTAKARRNAEFAKKTGVPLEIQPDDAIALLDEIEALRGALDAASATDAELHDCERALARALEDADAHRLRAKSFQSMASSMTTIAAQNQTAVARLTAEVAEQPERIAQRIESDAWPDGRSGDQGLWYGARFYRSRAAALARSAGTPAAPGAGGEGT